MNTHFLTLRTSLTPIVWGTTYFVVSAWLPANHPITAGMLRALPAGLILLLITKTLPQADWWWRSLVLGGLNIGIFFALLFIAAERLAGGIAAILVALAPIVAIILSPLLLRVYPSRIQVVAAGCAVLGVAAIALTSRVVIDVWGIAAGVGAALCMGLGMVLAKKWGQPANVTPLHTTAWQLTFGGLMLVPFAIMEGPMPDLDWVGIGGFAYLCIFGTLLAYPNLFFGLVRLDVTTVLLLGALSPVTALLIDIVTGQPPTLLQALGAIVVLVSVVVAQRS